MLLTESKVTGILTEGLRYHLQTGTPLYENIYRPGSEAYFTTIRQARLLMNEGVLQDLCFEDIELLFETEVGEYGEFEGRKVPLDFPMIEEISFVIPDAEATWQQASINPQIQKMGEEQWKKLSDISKASGGFGYTAKYTDIDPVLPDPAGDTTVTFSDDAQIQMPVVLKYEEAGEVKYEIVAGEDVLSSLVNTGRDNDPDIWVVDITSEALTEAKYKGKEVALNKPKRGGPKKFYVYTRNPKTGKIIKVNFGDTSGLSAKINNPEARRNFASRHNCATKKDKTKAGYWSCRLPRYAKLLGLKSNFGGFW
jgi:hypothetical protein